MCQASSAVRVDRYLMVIKGLAWPRRSCRARGSQALDGPGVPKEVGVDAFAQPDVGGGGADNLPRLLATNREKSVVRAQAPVEGVGLEAVDERGRTGHQPHLAALAHDLQGARLMGEMPHSEA
jgi:hypothetical protein